jgi:hypothetical protein
MRAFPVPAAALSALILLGGCSSGETSSTPDALDSPTTRTSSSAPEPTQTTTAATPSASPLSLADRLLPTGEVPGLNAQWRWQDGQTGPAAPEPFGFCAKVDLSSIGATEVVERTYFPPDDSDDNAAEQVAEFPDANTAARAWTVLKSWHDRCGKSISADIAAKVRPLTSVPVPAGSARWYLVSWQPVGEETGRFEAFGMVLAGTRIAVLKMDNSGQDYNYPAGKEPMAEMTVAAADGLR